MQLAGHTFHTAQNCNYKQVFMEKALALHQFFTKLKVEIHVYSFLLKENFPGVLPLKQYCRIYNSVFLLLCYRS